jgi:hypothetical protein
LRVLASVQAENELAHARATAACSRARAEQAREHLDRALENLERLGTRRDPGQVREDLAQLSDG